MFLCISSKFKKHFDLDPEYFDQPEQKPSLFETWNVDLFSNGPSQLIFIVTEEHSLFSLLIPFNRSKIIKNFYATFKAQLDPLLVKLAIPEPNYRHWDFIKRSNRGIIGSQNELKFLAKGYLEDYQRPISKEDLQSVEDKINETPMSYLKMNSPKDALWKQNQSL